MQDKILASSSLLTLTFVPYLWKSYIPWSNIFFFFILCSPLKGGLIVLRHHLQLGCDICSFWFNTSNLSIAYFGDQLCLPILTPIHLSDVFPVGLAGRQNTVLVRHNSPTLTQTVSLMVGRCLIHFSAAPLASIRLNTNLVIYLLNTQFSVPAWNYSQVMKTFR